MKKHFLFLLTLAIICFTQSSAQKRTFYQEGKLVDTAHSPVLKYFSSFYDTVFAYVVDAGWAGPKLRCKLFAIKQNKYFKIDCLFGYYKLCFCPDSIQITKTVAISNMSGKAFLDTLASFHVYHLSGNKNMGCHIYDSTGAIKSSIITEDLTSEYIQFFNKNTFRTVEYYAPQYLYKLCHDPKLIPTIKLIDLFEKEG